MRFVLSILLFTTIASCNIGNSSLAQKNNNKQSNMAPSAALNVNAPVVIYKTRNDYANLVPITLSDDGYNITSYPDPKDLAIDENYLKPTKLKKGYLLDNRGITRNTAFIKMSYEVYAQLKEAPSLEKLKDLIIDRDPFEKIYNCGTRSDYNDLIPELNKIIVKKKFAENFKRVL